MTQADLAGTEYTKSYISQVENGMVWPSLPAMIYIAHRLGKPLDWFVTDEPAQSPVERAAAELGVEPERLKAALERLLFRPLLPGWPSVAQQYGRKDEGIPAGYRMMPCAI